ncbi:MAG: ferrochelatase, partial [Bacteroidota bacterium]
MTSSEFLRDFSDDPRLVTGGYFAQSPLSLVPGDQVGVVLLNVGGPTCVEDVEPFLYNLFMDPAIVDLPVPRFLRHRMARLDRKS